MGASLDAQFAALMKMHTGGAVERGQDLEAAIAAATTSGSKDNQCDQSDEERTCLQKCYDAICCLPKFICKWTCAVCCICCCTTTLCCAGCGMYICKKCCPNSVCGHCGTSCLKMLEAAAKAQLGRVDLEAAAEAQLSQTGGTRRLLCGVRTCPP